MNDELDGRITQVLADLFDVPLDQIGDDFSADTVEAWDSLRHMTLVLSLEEEFNVSFTDQETIELLSYKLIKLTLQDKLASQLANARQ